MDPSKIDWSFMKTGLNNNSGELVSDAEKIKISAMLITFVEEGLKTAGIYTYHSKRKIITKTDIQNGLKLETFQFLKKDLSTRIKEHETEMAKDFYCNDESEEESEEESDNGKYEEEEYSKSFCKCEICMKINCVLDNWSKWEPSTPLEKILKNCIESV